MIARAAWTYCAEVVQRNNRQWHSAVKSLDLRLKLQSNFWLLPLLRAVTPTYWWWWWAAKQFQYLNLLLEGAHSLWGPSATLPLLDALYEPDVQHFAEKIGFQFGSKEVKNGQQAEQKGKKEEMELVFSNNVTCTGLLYGWPRQALLSASRSAHIASLRSAAT